MGASTTYVVTMFSTGRVNGNFGLVTPAAFPA